LYDVINVIVGNKTAHDWVVLWS